MKCNGLQLSWLTRWRALAEGDSLLLCGTPTATTCISCPVLSSPLHLPPLLLLLPFGLLYLWLSPLMWKNPSSGPVDLEIEYSSRSAKDKPCSERAHPAKGAGGNEFQLGSTGGLCWLFSPHSVWGLWCSEAKTTLPTDWGLLGP